MKKTKITAILLVLILALALVSCGGNKEPAETKKSDGTEAPTVTEPVKPTYLKTNFANWQEYTIIYEDGADNVVSDAFIKFNLTLGEKYNFTPRANSDFLIPGETVPVGTLEILVGLTNRPESIQVYETLKANDYFIGMINNRLVILGGSDKATAAALEHFMMFLMEADTLYYPTEGYTYRSDYVVDKLTIGGVDISEFTLVRGNGMNSGEKHMIDYLIGKIADTCGANIETVLPSAKEETYEILVGDTGRELTSKEIAEGTYSIEQTDTKLALYGNGDNSASFVLKYLIIDILSAIPEGESYDIKVENVIAQPYSVPTFVDSNLPATFADMRDKYEYDILSADTTLARFYATVDELPDEVTVLDPVNIEDYPVSLDKKQVYVSTSGDDNNAGTKEAPYKTIEKALAEMKNQGGGVIWIEGGNYSIKEGITINANHSGTIISPLFIKSYGDGEVTLTSNILVESEGFKLVDAEADSVAARLKDDVKDKVYYINLFDLGWMPKDVVPVSTDGPTRVYVDDEEYTLAQYPNAFYEDGETRLDSKDLLYFKYVYDTGSVTIRDGSNLYWPWIERVNSDPNLTPDSVLGWEIRILNERDKLSDEGDGAMGDEILSWVNTGDIWYYGSVFEGWEHRCYTIDPECVHGDGLLGAPQAGGYYSLKSVQPNPWGCKVSGNSAAGRNTYYLFNAIEALDAPGEWFIDKETGNFYIYPKSGDITKQKVLFSGSTQYNLLEITDASNIVFDGISIDGTSGHAMRFNRCSDIAIQHATVKNTQESSIMFSNSERCAMLYSNLSRSHGNMLYVSNNESNQKLKPMDIFIQNNIFSDTPPTVSSAINLSGCRAVVSHNWFIDCCVTGDGVEHIVEYNRFEGGNKYITDGGMAYFGSYNTRGIHIRYNLFHMFKATHQAVYFDLMGSGCYSYYNVVSTLEAQTNSHKGWYSSTGHGNVCFGNIMVLRNKSQIDLLQGKDTDEGTEAIKKGDDVGESGLYYYYYGNNDKNNSLAGHWWLGYKESEVERYLVNANREAWEARYPDYMNFLEGTKAIIEAYDYVDYKVYYEPQKLSDKTHEFLTEDDTVIWVPAYEYLDENGAKRLKEEQILKAEDGKIILTFDDLAAMERLRRQPAFSVIKNNIILGGSTDPDNVITNSTLNNKGIIKDVTIKEDNYLEFDYDKILIDAENHNYKISDETWSALEKEMGKEFVSILKDLDYEKAGLTH